METLAQLADNEEYRDHLSTVDESGKRLWVYPKKPRGAFYNKRLIFSVFLLSLFFVTPFIQYHGRPIFLFNIFERKFVFFGTLFMPQDFHLVALGLITFFVFVILFTVVFGRLWCGWACPQTLFMEIVFRKIEYWIEGDANQQRKLNQQPWNQEKIIKKGTKFTIFGFISILIAHTAMAYLVGMDTVVKLVSQPPSHNWAGFIGLVAFTIVFFGVFSYLREQACIAICPYGRLQGVLLGKDSIVIAYDYVRGEPRGKLKRKDNVSSSDNLTLNDFIKPQGDCIDCKLCVQVCPTGIDIRNGTQLECVNCTACIDACDEVMDKIEKPRGLIRYASFNNIVNSQAFKVTPRIIAYSMVLVALLSLDAFLLLNREPLHATILKVRGTLYQEMPNGNVANMYEVNLVNKTDQPITITDFKITNKKGGDAKIAGNQVVVKGGESTTAVVVVELPKNQLDGMKTKVNIDIWSGNKKLTTKSVNFLGDKE